MKSYKKLLSLFLSIGIVFLSAYLTEIFSGFESEYYFGLNKPKLLPSAIVFIVAWSIIYAIMIVFLTTTVYRKERRNYAIFLILLLVLNIFYSLAFFVLKLPIIALFVIILQIVLLLFILNHFIDSTKYLWLMLIPVLLWYIFALYLQYLIVLLN